MRTLPLMRSRSLHLMGNAREGSVTLHRRGARREMPRRFLRQTPGFPGADQVHL